jgi:hypothetical protein
LFATHEITLNPKPSQLLLTVIILFITFSIPSRCSPGAQINANKKWEPKYLLCWHVRVIIKVGPQFDPQFDAQLVLGVFAIRVQFGSCQQMLKVIFISGEKFGFIIDLAFY